MSQSHPRLIWFSTEDIPSRDRIEVTRKIYGRTIIKHNIEPIPRDTAALQMLIRYYIELIKDVAA